ncbi:class I SAM-dependent methyltransferase [Anaeromicropila populeti]|uniref:Methyltransferase domain-containing protein n=1 Tax=Anaeromicropila populeti TaxID=37658 RepID=A0A1I6IZ19_9FIRM|nr:class I SAM-dependent methyltransferase [Anaeromicropila populeti]SFR71995.1 Methyltransferase domain-containing protein [Anaeromicropila populeti]
MRLPVKKEHIDEMKSWGKGRLKIWEQQVAANFPSGARILDIGCGLGREAFALYNQGFEVDGLDISKDVADKANEEAVMCDSRVRFYPYIEHVIYWETFSLEELENYAKQTGYDIVMSGEGEIYVPEDGIVLYCLCRLK